MLTDKKSNNIFTPPQKFFRAQSIIHTINLACLHKNDQDSDFWALAESAQMAEQLIGEALDELEKNEMDKKCVK